MNIRFVKTTFFVGALFDGFFGVMGILFPYLACQIFEMTQRNHAGYVQFPAILFLIFAVMFYQVARDPITNRVFMFYSVALKAGYSVLIFYYLLTSGIPAMWVPWAWIDLVFLVLFLLSWRYTGGSNEAGLPDVVMPAAVLHRVASTSVWFSPQCHEPSVKAYTH